MNPASSWAARDEDELEGAFLLPVACQVDDERGLETPGIVLARFAYSTAIAEENQQQQQQQQVENVAYTIPRHDKAAIADDSHTRVKLAERRGQMASEEEKDAIRKVNREVYSKNYFSSHAVEAANQRARIRDADGLQVEDREIKLPSHEHASSKGTVRSGTPAGTAKVGGYAVNEYLVRTSYNTNEYETQEYHSVYE
jgi:hypothetical protein